MMQTLPFIFLIILISNPLLSQTIPEEYLHMAYHFSFSDENKEDIKLIIQAKENDSSYPKEGGWEKDKTQKGKDVFFELHQGYPTSRGNTFIFSKGKEEMAIRATEDIFDIPFMSGRYNIPQEFAPLFQIEEGTSKVINQDISSFRVKEWSDEVVMISARGNVPKGMTFTSHIDKVGQSEYFIAGDDMDVFVYQPRMKKWNKFELPLNKEQHYIEHVSAGDKSNLFATIYDRETKTRFTMHSKNGGDEWKRHRILSSLGVDWIKMYDKKIGYALGWLNEEYTAFYSTENGGKTWHRIYEMKGDKYTIFDTPSPRKIVIRNESNYGYPVYYKSNDGGNSWKVFKENNDLGFVEKNIFFQNNLFSKKGRNENAQLIFPKEKRAYFNFTEKDKTYQAIYANGYILYSKDGGNNWMFYPIIYGNTNHRPNDGRNYLKGNIPKLFFSDEKTLLFFSNRTLFEIKIP